MQVRRPPPPSPPSRIGPPAAKPPRAELRGMGIAEQDAALRPGGASPLPARRGDVVGGGPELAEVQRRLDDEGFDSVEADGIMGPRTRAAVVAFQRARGLDPDGIIGPLTCGALGVEAPAPTGPAPATPAPNAGRGGGGGGLDPALATALGNLPNVHAQTGGAGPSSGGNEGPTLASNAAYLAAERAHKSRVDAVDPVAQTHLARDSTTLARASYDTGRQALVLGTMLLAQAEALQASPGADRCRSA